MELGWEFDLRIEVSVVQSRALTFDPQFGKITSKSPNVQPKGILAFTDA